jgi:Glycine zipper 2TM domain
MNHLGELTQFMGRTVSPVASRSDGEAHYAWVEQIIKCPKEDGMRKFMIAMSAVAMTVPTLIVAAPAAQAQSAREWRGSDGRLYCRRGNGTVGMVVGGAGGALLGRAVDRRGSRATGTILGAAAGALLGRELQRGRRCR